MTNYTERTQEVEHELAAIVSQIDAKNIVLLFSDNEEGGQQEIMFPYSVDVRYENRNDWDDIKVGDEVVAVYMTISRIREGFKDSEFTKETAFMGRRLIALRFEKIDRKTLRSE